MLSPLVFNSRGWNKAEVAGLRDDAWDLRELWRALIRAWGLSWRFYDRPDQYLEIRPRPGDPWIPLHRPTTFRIWNVALAPTSVDKLWCEGRLRALVEQAASRGTLSVAEYQTLGERLAQRCAYDGIALPAKGWSLRSLGALDHALHLEIHCSEQARPSC